jgi:hypothetical protein
VSNIVDQAAIMAPPPVGDRASSSGLSETFKPANIVNLILVGGIMWIGGKAASYLWSYLGLDEKPKRKRSRIAEEEPEELEEYEPDEEEE